MTLLDTDVFVDILRGFPPALEWLRGLGSEVIAVPGFVAMELIQGCRDKQQLAELNKQLVQCRILWPDADTCAKAMRVFSDFHLSHSLGLLDAVIGQTAIASGLPLNSFNRRHYVMIPGLVITEPYQR